jgi:hypothetical protein
MKYKGVNGETIGEECECRDGCLPKSVLRERSGEVSSTVTLLGNKIGGEGVSTILGNRLNRDQKGVLGKL